jgi:hypothetical protein
MRLVIDELTTRASQNDLIALIATSHQTRPYNAALARELHGMVAALQKEFDRTATLHASRLIQGELSDNMDSGN